jgi:3-phosphoshikimate 1-carboxyvinyltransferase
MPTLITDNIAELARVTPRAPAIIQIRERAVATWSWEKLQREAERVAALLLRLNVQPGEPVAYQLPNRGEFAAVTLAIVKVGAICLPLKPLDSDRDLTHKLSKARAKVIFVADEFAGRRYALDLVAQESILPDLLHVIVVRTSEVKTRLPASRRLNVMRLNSALEATTMDQAVLLARRPRSTDLALLLFTSGTSGPPKGVLYRHKTLTRAAQLYIAQLQIRSDDRVFVPSTLAHQIGFVYGMWVAFAMGIPQMLQPVWDPERAVRALRELGGTVAQAPPSFLINLVNVVKRGVRAPDSLRVFVPTGAAIPPGLAREAEEILRTRICGAFGTTESFLSTLSKPTASKTSSDSDGEPLPSIRLRVVDDTGTVLGPGHEGHLQVHSPVSFACYLDDPELTAQAFTGDGWYRTNDLAMVDQYGFVHLRGTSSDAIRRSGKLLTVLQVEQLLNQHRAIREIAIVGVPDRQTGERACAFVVPRSDDALDLKSVQAFLDQQRVTRQYWPERLELVSSLPKTASGKIKRYLLREQFRNMPV